MSLYFRAGGPTVLIFFAVTWIGPAGGADLVVVRKAPDPYGAPRPSPGEHNVPLRTSIYVELAPAEKNSADLVLSESVVIDLAAAIGPVIPVLGAGRKFAPGFHGRFLPASNAKAGNTLGIYVEGDRPLLPTTTYTLRLQARAKSGGALPDKQREWTFTTEGADASHEVDLIMPANSPEVVWQGGFFRGYCIPSFCTSSKLRIPTFDLMANVRKTSPRAWSWQRDFWLTGMERELSILPKNLPNIVHERETRHIAAIEQAGAESTLRVEDFFGHEQYGIPPGRPLSLDFHPGDKVLVADTASSAQGTVVRVDDTRHAVTVSDLKAPSGGWKLEYSRPLPKLEDPDAPGLFPSGGCNLLKLSPAGTPCYYWGRLDHEWDLGVNRYQRRVVVNFADAAGDLSIDGRNWTTAKDYVELHEATRAITSHIIDRYGDKSLTFAWSIFNEPDLGSLFWRASWADLQKFYDYSTDGVLRAFEEHGHDSDGVFVGGLELAGIFGTNLKLREFLVHCSPAAARVPGAVLLNAAFADARLTGKRSRRVEKLCGASGGRGAPCDFVSIHAYNRSKTMADKLARAKEMALEVDPRYYRDLWINSHEACPGWQPPPDPAYGDSYLGNGYFPTWCADVARRQLQRAAADARYARGETLLTFWPWPNGNFGGGNDCVRAVNVSGEGGEAAVKTIPMPILNFLGLLAEMGPHFSVLDERIVEGHVVSGFISQLKEERRALVYAHNMADTESRSGASFAVSVEFAGLPKGPCSVREFRFDRDHNSYFRAARRLREETTAKIAQKAEQEPNPAQARRALSRVAYPAPVVQAIAKEAELHATAQAQHQVGPDGRLRLKLEISANGADYVVVEPIRP